jgi:hypothetical protein
MTDLLQNPMFIIWTGITLICVVPSLAYYWAKIRKAELDAALKREMLQRGMLAEEIERVLAASSERKPEKPGLSQRRGTGADSSALGAEPSALAQGIGADDFATPPGVEERRANRPGMYTAPYTASEKVPEKPGS